MSGPSIGIFPLDGKWEANTWYRGKCSMRIGNPQFDVLIYSGFLDRKGNPAGYSGVFASNCVPSEPVEDVWSVTRPRFLKVTEKLFTRD